MEWNPAWANAIASIESQGSGGYSAVGPQTAKGDRAYGKYQVMDFNIPTWTQKHLGQKLTPEQFLASPEAQDTVFRGEFGSSVQKYGNPQDAASVWFTGRPASQGAGRSDILGTTGSKYVNKFNSALGQASTQGAAPMMQQEQKPRGLLGSLGIQKMEEGAEGETGQRFYNRDSFKDTAATLAQGFGRMGIMGMEEIADSVANQRTEAKARNKTMEMLGKMGTPQANSAIEYIKAGGAATDALKIAFEKPEAATPSSAVGKLQSDLASGLINQEQYDVALASMAPKGMSLEIGPDGTRFVQGAGVSTKPLTEGQSKATGYYGKAEQAEEVLSALEQQGTGLYDSLVSNVPIAGNYMISNEYQQYSQAKRNFINSILRQESGAAIGKDEFANAEQQYFPQPGEGPAVIAQKAANRRRAIEGLRVAAGEGAGRISSSTPSGVIEYDATGKRIQK